jgi:hypothetical protein
MDQNKCQAASGDPAIFGKCGSDQVSAAVCRFRARKSPIPALSIDDHGMTTLLATSVGLMMLGSNKTNT